MGTALLIFLDQVAGYVGIGWLAIVVMVLVYEPRFSQWFAKSGAGCPLNSGLDPNLT